MASSKFSEPAVVAAQVAAVSDMFSSFKDTWTQRNIPTFDDVPTESKVTEICDEYEEDEPTESEAHDHDDDHHYHHHDDDDDNVSTKSKKKKKKKSSSSSSSSSKKSSSKKKSSLKKSSSSRDKSPLRSSSIKEER